MLEQLIGNAYRAHVLDRKGLDITSRILREAFEADDSLRVQAQARLASITEMVAKRDHISRVTRDVLRAALAQENT